VTLVAASAAINNFTKLPLRCFPSSGSLPGDHPHTALFAKNPLDFSLQTCAAGTGMKAAGKVAQTLVSRNTTRILDLRHDVPDIE
jgi:hypothetical protein